MKNYDLNNEVILHEEKISSDQYKGNIVLLLTSKRIILQKEKGLLKKKMIIETINLNDIIIYNNKVQIKAVKNYVNIQTNNKYIKLHFSNILNANIFVSKVINEITGTTFTKRSADKIKSAVNIVDNVIGVDARNKLLDATTSFVTAGIVKGVKVALKTKI